MDKQILITGAAGFIGYHLFVKLTREGNHVLGLDNFDHPCGARAICTKGDVRNQAILNDIIAGVDEVYHLAAQIHVDRSYEDPQLTFDVNVGGTENVLKACKKFNKRLIFASTSEIYGTAQTDAISEEHSLNPQSPYAESKRQAELLCADYAKKGVQVVIVRGFNTYGPFQSDNHYGAVIPIFFKRISRGQSPEIFGDGTQTRDFMYITDALDAYGIAARSAPSGQPINFGTGEEVSINSLSDLILAASNSRLEAVHQSPRPNEVMRLKANITKARALGFNPKIKIKEGLKMYTEWLQKKGG